MDNETFKGVPLTHTHTHTFSSEFAPISIRVYWHPPCRKKPSQPRLSVGLVLSKQCFQGSKLIEAKARTDVPVHGSRVTRSSTSCGPSACSYRGSIFASKRTDRIEGFSRGWTQSLRSRQPYRSNGCIFLSISSAPQAMNSHLEVKGVCVCEPQELVYDVCMSLILWCLISSSTSDSLRLSSHGGEYNTRMMKMTWKVLGSYMFL